MVNDPSFADMNYLLQTIIQSMFTVELIMKVIVITDKVTVSSW